MAHEHTPIGLKTPTNNQEYLDDLERAKLMKDTSFAATGFANVMNHVRRNRGKAAAYFSREFGFPCCPIFDWYYVPGGVKRELLGFAVVDSEQQMICHNPFENIQHWDMTREQYNMLLTAKDTPSGFPTVWDLDPSSPTMPEGTQTFVKVQDIYVNSNQRLALTDTENAFTPVEDMCQRLVFDLQQNARIAGSSLFGRFSKTKHVAESSVEDGQGIHRYMFHARATVREKTYGEALGQGTRLPIHEIRRSFDKFRERIMKLRGKHE